MQAVADIDEDGQQGPAPFKIAVIGCGNPNCSDDGAGVEVIRLLRMDQRLSSAPGLHLLDAGTDGMAVMFAARGCQTLIVIDACKTGAEAGALYEVSGPDLETQSPHSFNLHDFRWDHALYAGRQIYKDQFPSDVTAFLIEVRSVELGVGLTTAIEQSARRVAEKVTAKVFARLGRADAGFAPP